MRSRHARRFIWALFFCAALGGALSLAACGSGGAGSMNSGFLGGGGGIGGGGNQTSLKQLSTDTFTNPQSQHATEVEPGMAAFNSTLVTAFQVGRMFSAGASDIGFATSTDGGSSWTHGLLNGITTFQGGNYLAASDATVAYDQAHSMWIIASLGVAADTDTVIVSRSADGRNWGASIIVSLTPDADKPWITCDNNSNSRFFGHCYIEWDDPSQPANGLVSMSTSTNGGLTWLPALHTTDMLAGVGGQPVVMPNGTVVVAIQSADGMHMEAFRSLDGGVTWNTSVTISTITDHLVAGGIRTSPLPSAATDSSGKLYVVWQDCRFRTNCVSNDIILTTSTDGIIWRVPVAIPIDGITTSTVDHFIPALAVDPATGSGAAHLALTYYFFSNTACAASMCQLSVGSIASSDGGNHWGTATTLAGPMSLNSLPNTTSGLMVGDYVATAYASGQPRAVFAVAQPKAGSRFAEAINTTVNPLPQMHEAQRPVVPADRAVTQHSDHPPRQYYDLDNEHPVPRK